MRKNLRPKNLHLTQLLHNFAFGDMTRIHNRNEMVVCAPTKTKNMHTFIQRHLRYLLSTLFFMVCSCCIAAAENNSLHASYGGEDNPTAIVKPQEKPQATLANLQELARICCTQPVRTISPLEQTPTQRINIRTQKLFTIQKASFLNYCGLGKWLSSPMVSPSPRVYYVFTWRHLLC